MRRATAVAVLALLAAGGADAPALAAQPAHPEATPPLTLKPAIPPALAALEAKADTLEITSQRVSLSTSFHFSKPPKGFAEFAKLLELKIEGVETTTPPAAALEMKLFGAQLRLRYVEGHIYMFSWALGQHDGGRPWVELGHGVIGRFLGNVGKKPAPGPVSGAARFGKIFTLVNDGIGLHEVAPTTLYGQPVTGFEEEIEQKAASEGISSSGVSTGFSSAKHPAPAAPKPKLSIYFASTGAPVRVQIATGTARVGLTLTIDFPAIDFPYTIPAPPPSHVISEAALLKRSKLRRTSHRVSVGAGGESKQ